MTTVTRRAFSGNVDLWRLRSHGASQVFVETDNYRDAALTLYESAGFRVIRDVLVYAKVYQDA